MNLKSRKIISIALVFFMMLTILPLAPATAHAAGTSGGGITLSGDLSDWNIAISDEGVLSWDAQASATKYELEFYEGAADAYPEVFIGDLTKNSCDLKAAFEAKKIEHNGFYLSIKALNGTTLVGDTKSSSNTPDIRVWYESSLPKLSEPHNLTWDGYTAKWDSVPNATGYKVTLYKNNYAQKDCDVTLTEFNYEGSGVLPKDGWWFTVEATRDGYRNSNAAESPKYGTSVTPPEDDDNTITSVNLTNFVVPSDGDNTSAGDPAATAESSKGYTFRYGTWFDSTGADQFTGEFEAGETYIALLALRAEEGYEFAPAGSISATVKDANSNTLTVKSVSVGNYSRENDTADVRVEFTIPAEGGETPAPTEYDITVTGGTASANKAVAGIEITIKANEPEDGKVFDKWIFDGITVEDPTAMTITFTMPANAVKVEATYKDQTYTVNYLVTLEYNNGSESAKFLVASGATVTKPADPTREGYIFKGWFLGETEYDFATKVTGPITLTAKWEEHTHAWGDVTYTWAEDGSSCKAERVCTKDASHKETATATITSAVKTPATETEKGTTTYTATFAETWAVTQTKDIQDIPVLTHEHTYATEWTTDRSNHWHKATCGHDVIADKAAHSYGGDRVCDICNYKKPSSGGSYGGGSYVAPDKDADSKLRIVMQINNKNILVNGSTITNDVAPVIVGDRTLVPIRVVTELLGGSADWDNDTRTVTLKIDGKTMNMTIGKPIPGFGTSAVIMNDRTYVPVRYVMEKLGAEVEWINATRQIIIEK